MRHTRIDCIRVFAYMHTRILVLGWRVLHVYFGSDISELHCACEMLKLCRVTKVKVFFLVQLHIFNFDLFEFSATILEKGLLQLVLVLLLIGWKSHEFFKPIVLCCRCKTTVIFITFQYSNQDHSFYIKNLINYLHISY